jgi:DNA-binding NarL/FixJ family response regulator
VLAEPGPVLLSVSPEGDLVTTLVCVVVRIVLAEDSALLREGIRRLIADVDDLQLVGVCRDYDELIALVEADPPDVVITDIRMPPSYTDEGIRAANHLRTSAPTTGVVVLSQYVSPAYALALLSDGSAGRGYLLKESVADVEELVRAVRLVASGGSMIAPQVVDALVTATRAAGPGHESLTPRERQVMAEVASGKSNGAIAAALGMSDRGVEKHINAVFAKLGLGDERDINRRVTAVLLYLAGGEGSHTATAPGQHSVRYH